MTQPTNASTRTGHMSLESSLDLLAELLTQDGKPEQLHRALTTCTIELAKLAGVAQWLSAGFIVMRDVPRGPTHRAAPE